MVILSSAAGWLCVPGAAFPPVRAVIITPMNKMLLIRHIQIGYIFLYGTIRTMKSTDKYNHLQTHGQSVLLRGKYSIIRSILFFLQKKCGYCSAVPHTFRLLYGFLVFRRLGRTHSGFRGTRSELSILPAWGSWIESGNNLILFFICHSDKTTG